MLALVFLLLDVVAALLVAGVVFVGLARSPRTPRAWLVVLAATTAYAVYTNVVAHLISYTPSMYILVVCAMLWDKLTRSHVNPGRLLQEYGAVTLLLASWAGVSLLPTLVALLLRFVGSRRPEHAEDPDRE